MTPNYDSIYSEVERLLGREDIETGNALVLTLGVVIDDGKQGRGYAGVPHRH